MSTRRQNVRPSPKELNSKLAEARNCLASNHGFFVDEKKMTSDLIELELSKASEIWPLVKISLQEIVADNYCGGYPPIPSYEETVLGEDCWQFAWDSSHFGKRMFLRFMLMNGNYFHSSLHESRKEKLK